MQEIANKVVFFFAFLYKYSLDFAFLVGFGERFGERFCRFGLYFQGVKVGISPSPFALA
jgi:hypothetical protein